MNYYNLARYIRYSLHLILRSILEAKDGTAKRLGMTFAAGNPRLWAFAFRPTDQPEWWSCCESLQKTIVVIQGFLCCSNINRILGCKAHFSGCFGMFLLVFVRIRQVHFIWSCAEGPLLGIAFLALVEGEGRNEWQRVTDLADTVCRLCCVRCQEVKLCQVLRRHRWHWFLSRQVGKFFVYDELFLPYQKHSKTMRSFQLKFRPIWRDILMQGVPLARDLRKAWPMQFLLVDEQASKLSTRLFLLLLLISKQKPWEIDRNSILSYIIVSYWTAIFWIYA